MRTEQLPGDVQATIRIFIEWLLVGSLLLLFCYRIWDVGVTDHDDAEWVLKTAKGIDPIADWAIDQGRLGGIIVGQLLLYGEEIRGTVFGEFVNIGSLGYPSN